MLVDDRDCVAYSLTGLRLQDNAGQGLALQDGKNVLVLLDTRQDAQRAWDIAKQFTRLCSIGRGNKRPNQRDYVVQYWK